MRKSVRDVFVKDAERGEVEAVFATFGVVDRDGDVTYKDAFQDGAPVVISAYGHASWDGALPVGKGTIHVTDDEAIFKGRFFLNTASGRETFEVVKELASDDGPGQEWSYGLVDVKAERGEVDGKKVRILKQITVPEVSPVLMGAGIDTRTLATKGVGTKQPNSAVAEQLRALGRERWTGDNTWVWLPDYDLDEGWAVYEVESPDEFRLLRVPFTRDGDSITLAAEETEVQRQVAYAPKSHTFAEQARSVVADVAGLVTRAEDVMALRAQKGKGIAPASAELLDALDGNLQRLKELLAVDPPTDSSDDTDTQDALAGEFLRFVASAQGVQP